MPPPRRPWIAPSAAAGAAASVAALLLAAAGCGGGHSGEVPVIAFEVVDTHPHDPRAFTQGLLYRDGFLYESTGREGRSTLRRAELATGRIDRIVHLADRHFGEGLALLDGRLYQLTWKSELGFIYDVDSFERLGEFRYEGEGWGLTTDGEHLVMSNGSSTLRFLDPETFATVRELTVRDPRGEVDLLNELEFVEGEIFANRFETDEIVRISPRDGRVTGRMIVAGLQRPRPPGAGAVANGIAYDPESGRLYLTGKLWPTVYAVRLAEE